VVGKGVSWRARELISGEDGLISEEVAPRCEDSDKVIADEKILKDKYPDDYSDIVK